MVEFNTEWLQQRKYRFREMAFWAWSFRCNDNDKTGVIVLYNAPGITEPWRVQYCENAKCVYVYFDADYNVTRIVIDNETCATVKAKKKWQRLLTPILHSLSVIYALDK